MFECGYAKGHADSDWYTWLLLLLAHVDTTSAVAVEVATITTSSIILSEHFNFIIGFI